jgi:hypothetical protein
MTSYSDFLDRKRIIVTPSGMKDPPALSPLLFPFQRDIVRWALRRGKACLFEECGLGKGWQALEWARVVSEHTNKPVLIQAPLAVAQQFVREGKKLSLDVNLCREAWDVKPGINVTNYDRAERFDPEEFSGVVLDECFAPGTLVDTGLGPLAIEHIHPGDWIQNASGIDLVVATHSREVAYAVEVRIGSNRIVCSPNHPWFTASGWVAAENLERSELVLRTSEAMCMVREGLHAEVSVGSEARKILRQVLLGEMAHETTGDQGEGALSRSSAPTGDISIGLAKVRFSGSYCGTREDSSVEPEQGSSSSSKDIATASRDWPQASEAGRKREGDDGGTGSDAECARPRVDPGVCGLTGQTQAGLSDLLQAGPSQPGTQDRNRAGRIQPLQQTSPGPEEGLDAGFARVDSVEILEPGDPRLEALRAPDGKLYFYDLEAKRHPSFSVAGFLVHNSSILKCHDGKTRNALIQAWGQTPWKLCCTATPAPNDHEELGNHAEFLGVMSRTEMLSSFFCHDGGETQKWRLKGHAEKNFWRWVASWAVSITKPSDIGYSDEGYDLPPLLMQEHIVEVDHQMARKAGMLFAMDAKTLQEERAARRGSLAERVQVAADLANASDRPWLLWCDLNDESTALTRAVTDAVEIRGSDDTDIKEQRMLDFIDGRSRVLVSKPSIAGFGVNLQHCSDCAFVGLSHSFEALYQATRRVWRFGQIRPVNAHIIYSSIEGRVVQNIRRKQADAERMVRGMVEAMSDITREELGATEHHLEGYEPKQTMRLPEWLQEQA